LALSAECIKLTVPGLTGMVMTTNLAVAGFAATSMAMHYWCDQRRQEEAKGMALAIAGMKMLNEKKSKEKMEVEEANKAAAEKLAKKSSWW
jgi:hypothetical protein